MKNTNLKVLCVDDDPFSLETLTETLRRIGGVNIETAEDAKSALSMTSLWDGSIDVILMDIHMPDIDGIEFIQALGRTGFTGSVGVISGAVDVIKKMTEIVAFGRGIKLLGVLEKPVSFSELDALLKRASEPN